MAPKQSENLGLPSGVIDPYEFLGVPSAATKRDIQRAYRRKALDLHPDKNPDDKEAELHFHRLQETYEFLIDITKRSSYDKLAQRKQEQQVRFERQTSTKRKFAEELLRRETSAPNKFATSQPDLARMDQESAKRRARQETEAWMAEQVKVTADASRYENFECDKYTKDYRTSGIEITWEPQSSLLGTTLAALEVHLQPFGVFYPLMYDKENRRALFGTDQRSNAVKAALHFLKGKKHYEFSAKYVKDAFHIPVSSPPSVPSFFKSESNATHQKLPSDGYAFFEASTLDRLRDAKIIMRAILDLLLWLGPTNSPRHSPFAKTWDSDNYIKMLSPPVRSHDTVADGSNGYTLPSSSTPLNERRKQSPVSPKHSYCILPVSNLSDSVNAKKRPSSAMDSAELRRSSRGSLTGKRVGEMKHGQATVAMQQQLELLQQENLCLQSDNAVLLSQLDEQTACLSAVIFDLERSRSRLEELNTEIPESMFDIVTSRIRVPSVDILSGRIPASLLEQAKLTETERVRFNNIQDVVNCINDLQVRLRESHIYSVSAANDRVKELEDLMLKLKIESETATEARDFTEHRLNKELEDLIHSRDVAVSRCAALEQELADVAECCSTLRKNEQTKLAEMNLESFQEKIASLHDTVVTLTAELDAARAENSALRAAKLTTQKELDYYTTSLDRERKQADILRSERDNLLDDLSHQRTSTAEATSEIMVLQSKVDLIERVGRSKDSEIENWKSRTTVLQQQLAEELARWDTSLKETLGRLSKTEVELLTAMARADQYEAEIARKSKELSLLENARLADNVDAEEKLRSARFAIEASEAHCRSLKQQMSELEDRVASVDQEKQVLASQLATVESQAQVLKERHPSLDFEVMEDQLQLFEEEKRQTAEELSKLRAVVCEAENRIGSLEALLAATKKTCAQQKQLSEEANKRENAFREELSKNIEELETLKGQKAELFCRMDSMTKSSDTLKDTLLKTEEELLASKSELETVKTEHLKQLHLLNAELEDAKRATRLENLEIEAERHGHRLEIQAHGRDLERFERVQQEFERSRQHNNQEVARLTSRIVDLEANLANSAAQLAESKRREEYLEADRRRLLSETEMSRRLLQDKLDTLEFSDDGLKQQLAEYMRAEELLRRETDLARIEAERSRLECQTAQGTIEKLQVKIQGLTDEIEKLQEELASNQLSVLNESHEQKLSLLQVRYDRLSQDHKHLAELKRQTEKNLNDLIGETEPLRKREAVLQGELASTSNLLNLTMKDVQAYKQKYLNLAKGVQAELEEKIVNLNQELSNAKKELESQNAQFIQEKSILNTEIEALKFDYERGLQETATFKLQLQAASSQIQTLQAQRSHSENSEIQKRYQVQLSNLQRLLQQLNQEKDQLKNECFNVQQLLQQEQSTKERSIQQHKAEVQGLREQLATFTGEQVSKETVANVLEEALRIGIMSSLLIKQLQSTSAVTGTCDIDLAQSSIIETEPVEKLNERHFASETIMSKNEEKTEIFDMQPKVPIGVQGSTDTTVLDDDPNSATFSTSQVTSLPAALIPSTSSPIIHSSINFLCTEKAAVVPQKIVETLDGSHGSTVHDTSTSVENPILGTLTAIAVGPFNEEGSQCASFKKSENILLSDEASSRFPLESPCLTMVTIDVQEEGTQPPLSVDNVDRTLEETTNILNADSKNGNDQQHINESNSFINLQ